MTPTYKIITIVAIGAILFSFAFWWENSTQDIDTGYVKLGGVTFHTSIEPGIREAKNLSKPVFVYFRSQTCYWCIVFEEEALMDERIIAILNREFVLISIDTFKQEKAALNLNVRTSPYMIFFDKDGKEFSRIPGYLPKEEFLVKLNETLERSKVS
jgi:thioredoxin-related protein